MSNNFRIRTTPNGEDKYLKVKLQQDFDFIEILSLKISQEEVYQNFCADYGVVVGRVNVNNGFGVPNVKVSIFIPVDGIDKEDSEIFKLYPYEKVTDRDYNGFKYNLLPNSGDDSECYSPTGSFPNKRQILDNEILLDIHKKYYKFTTTTNSAGDFMIFGVPVGQHFLHVDGDMSDVGVLSQKPYDFIRQGADFKEFDSTTKFKSSNNLASLSHIKTNSPIGVRVKSFWGEEENCDIGITRVDVDLGFKVEPHAIFMGSIFTDDEKNSISKSCRARKKAGRMEELKTGSGRIEMLRKTSSGGVERFDINDSEINDHGSFAYQIPMNLEYVVTDEFGNLIPSDNPTKGLPTKTNVRFRMSMGPDGNEGRLRTRAKYLIPNNPTTKGNSDYTFDEDTKDESFFEMSWNKIYTVKNYIARLQPNKKEENRNFTGIKNLADNKGNNPIPYNRMDKDFNPLFSIICLLVSIISSIVSLINYLIIPIISFIIWTVNLLIKLINVIIDVVGSICKVVDKIVKLIKNLGGGSGGSIGSCNFGSVSEIGPVPCITLICEDKKFAPGCGTNPIEDVLNNNDRSITQTIALNGFVETDFCNPTGTFPCTFITCLIGKLIDALNIVEYDFYNDWLNGSLYFHLFKYKSKRRSGRRKYCEYDCDDFDSDSDNKCNSSWIIDIDSDGNVIEGAKIKEGVIKDYEGELYYASMVSGNRLLYGTDIISIGAVNGCDWEGIPVMYNLLPESSMYLPPNTKDIAEDGTVEESGQLGSYIDNDYVFFKADCFRVHSIDWVNLRRISELGLGGDELRPEDATGPDGIINYKDIENFFVRDSFAWINKYKALGRGLSIGDASPVNTVFSNTDYSDFRVNNSFFFYFGLHQGATSITQMGLKYFAPCPPTRKNGLQVLGTITQTSTSISSDGGVDIEVVGGTQPYTYSWSNGATTQDISNIPIGLYTVTVTDSNNLQGKVTFNVTGPLGVSCSLDKSDITSYGAGDGEIQVNINNGQGPFGIVLTGPSPSSVNLVTSPNSHVFPNLLAGSYTVTTTDNFDGTTCIKNIDILEPVDLTLTVTTNGALCYDGPSATLSLSGMGGVLPYTFLTSGTASITISNETFTQFTNILPGTYTSQIVDANGDTDTVVTNVANGVEMEIYDDGATSVTCNGDGDGTILIHVLNTAIGDFDVYLSLNGSSEYIFNRSYNGGGTFLINSLIAGNYRVKIIDSNGCEKIATWTRTIFEPTELTLANFDRVCDSIVSPICTSNGLDLYYRPRTLSVSGKIVGGVGGNRVRWYASDTNGNPEVLIYDSFDTTNVINQSNRDSLGIYRDVACGIDTFNATSTSITFWQQGDMYVRTTVEDSNGCTSSNDTLYVPHLDRHFWKASGTITASEIDILNNQFGC